MAGSRAGLRHALSSGLPRRTARLSPPCHPTLPAAVARNQKIPSCGLCTSLNVGANQLAVEEKLRFSCFPLFFLIFEANLYTFYTLIGILREEMMRTGGQHMPCLWEPGRQSTRPIMGASTGLGSTHPPLLPALGTCGGVFTFHNHSAWKKDESCA